MTSIGRFIVIEGPKGSGKTTTVKALSRLLPAETGRKCVSLAQPSNMPMGKLLRLGEATMGGHAYAMALAADRLAQYEQVVRPALQRGVNVVMSRYTPSSLVLQRMDGVPLEDVWFYNRHAPAPDALFYLRHTQDELRRRLQGRNRQTRIQTLGTPDRELQFYEDARNFLEDRDWLQYGLHGDGKTPEQLARHIIAVINRKF